VCVAARDSEASVKSADYASAEDRPCFVHHSGWKSRMGSLDQPWSLRGAVRMDSLKRKQTRRSGLIIWCQQGQPRCCLLRLWAMITVTS
jgi:hypothetical protein